MARLVVKGFIHQCKGRAILERALKSSFFRMTTKKNGRSSENWRKIWVVPLGWRPHSGLHQHLKSVELG